ncbi:MAG: hypothetical protein JWM90_1949 [Thermoleophilia bacterium]|nr:hypothetical protein [Thermoleophilia bacterium]
MKRLPATLIAGLTCLLVAPAVAEAAAPTVPASVTATVVVDGLRAASVDVAWTASSDPDGDTVSYEVQSIEGDAVSSTKTTATSTRLSLVRGRAYILSVAAVDATGSRSERSASITVTAPPIAVRLVAGISPRGGFAQACAGVARACTVINRTLASVRVRATSTAKLTDARVQLTVLWRKPGTTRFVVRPSVIAGVSTGRASIPAARFVTAPGTWCVRVRLAPNDGSLVTRAAFTPTCLRYAPPVAMG